VLPYAHFTIRSNSELVKDDAATIKKDCTFKRLETVLLTVTYGPRAISHRVYLIREFLSKACLYLEEN